LATLLVFKAKHPLLPQEPPSDYQPVRKLQPSFALLFSKPQQSLSISHYAPFAGFSQLFLGVELFNPPSVFFPNRLPQILLTNHTVLLRL